MPLNQRAADAAKRHLPFLVVLVAAIAVRVAFWIALRPGLMFADSWIYLNDSSPLSFLLYRPAGYVFVISLLKAQRNLGLITAIQHLAGVATGALVYDLCLRKGASRGLSTLAAGIYLLAAFTVILEQYVLTEALFALVLVASLRYAVLYPRSPGKLALSGFFLALSVLLRGAGIFAVPFWAAWLLIQNRRRTRALLAPALALLVPLGAYVASRNAYTDYGTLALHRGDGWFLYGRAMSFADCKSLKLPASEAPLCPAAKPANVPEWYVWAPDSPARTFFKDDKPAYNEVVRSVALKIITHQPATFVTTVARDVLRGFLPGGGGDSDASLVLTYRGGRPYPFDMGWPAARNIATKFKLSYRTPTVSRSSFVALYWRWMRVPRALIGLAGIAGLLTLARPGWRRSEGAPAAALLALTAFGMFTVSVAMSAFELRYMVPLVPLFCAAGAIGISVVGGGSHGQVPESAPA
jgi:hypothetical protein